MKLSIVDRLIITQSLLPETGTIDHVKLTIALRNKIGFNAQELEHFNITRPYNNILQIDNITEEMTLRVTNFDISINEISFLRHLAELSDNNGWVTLSSLGTIEYLINYTINDQE